MTTRTIQNKCVYCGYMIDSATHPTEDIKPKHNDISLCFKCGGLMQFNEDLTLRKIDEDAYREVITDDEIRNTITRIRAHL